MNEEDTLSRLRKLAVTKPLERKSLMNRIKSFLKKRDDVLTMEQVENIVEKRIESYKKSFEKKEKKEDLDLSKIWKYVDKVSKQKYGVDGTHMVQKTAWHFLLTTGGLPGSDSIIDKGERAVTRISSLSDKIDKISGKSASPFKELTELKKEIDSVVDFKKSMQQLEPPKELTVDDVFGMIGAATELIETVKAKKQGMETDNAIIVEQYPLSETEYKDEGI